MRKLKKDAADIHDTGSLSVIKKIMSVYTKTTKSSVRVYDHNYRALCDISDRGSAEENVCGFCPLFEKKPSERTNESCRELHIKAIDEANHSGGKYLYACKNNLAFWISPVFNEGQFLGALRGSGFIFADHSLGDRNTSKEFAACLRNYPHETREKIKSLAEMLHFCAASLSHDSDDYHEIIQRRIEQQKIITAKTKELKIEYSGKELPGYPMEKERLLIAALRGGNLVAALNLLNDILAVLLFLNSNHFKYIQLRAIELAVLLSRLDIDYSQKGNNSIETNSLCIKNIKQAKTFEELTDTMHSMVKRICGVIASFQGIPHAAAIRKAECFIHENFTRKISLPEIAAVSGLSAPYFSTIFKEEMGENLSKYLNRLRVEKASRMLLETDISLSNIARACCFEDQSWFSKIFKLYTGISPGKYRNQGGGTVSDISDNNMSNDYLNKVLKLR